ncbi:MAG TPA: tRNA (adenosine(37)-N6)-threonylcarbamoyltransferase complex dimerization subunit type 1 TsaB [Bacteroidales bacterium]|nr:tRNA (adenosine(37)-N6)-threonylcarbamoyltransferase complex dimerization subunit type 1 TsaB [Bacteroidales bacterium]HXK81953.1 tRNA (adenosine(37)-N6)-threonylcarbamoyltransferase complex dimerization subunit type 1 TsaB [Bacteroidales bacterium]
MDYILNIETSTEICSASVSRGIKTISYREHFIERSHAAILTNLIADVMKESCIEFAQLSAVAVSKGPGSYTGLRIGVSTAKGICFALNIPLIAIDTLAIIADMALENQHSENKDVLYIPMIDARRMEVYSAVYNKDLTKVRDVEANIIDNESFKEFNNKALVFCGNGSDKCKDVISISDSIFLPNIFPSAKFMTKQAHQKFINQEFEDVAYFEPYYLKDFIATIPKNKVLGER